MTPTNAELTAMLQQEQFPLSAKYDAQWILKHSMGPHPLWLAEWLCQSMDLKAGMRVLDMGCGEAITSIFLAQEFGVQVWANDLWIKPSDNWARIREAGVEDRVFPIHAEARSLPYAEGFFDAIVSVDSYFYYGTDDLYLKYFSRFVKPGGQIGIAEVALVRDFDGPVPDHLARPQQNGAVFWADDCFAWHPPQWWRRHWEKTGLVDIERVDARPDGCALWLQHHRAALAAGTNRFPSDVEALEKDAGQYIGFVRMVARRKGQQP